jgi:hypothetical protein
MICELVASLGVNYINFFYSFILLSEGLEVFGKKYFFFFFSFLLVQQVLKLLRLLDYGAVAKISCLYTFLPMQRQVLTIFITYNFLAIF